MLRIRVFKILRNHLKLSAENDCKADEDRSCSSPVVNMKSADQPPLPRKSMTKTSKRNIFRRVTSKRSKTNNFKLLSRALQPTKTISLSEDEDSNGSSLFSPVEHGISRYDTSATPSQPSQAKAAFFIPGEDEIIRYKTEIMDITSEAKKKDVEISHLKSLIKDLVALHDIELELRDIEVSKKDLELERLKTELSQAKFDTEEQSMVIEALATEHHKHLNRSWFSAIPDLFIDLI